MSRENQIYPFKANNLEWLNSHLKLYTYPHITKEWREISHKSWALQNSAVYLIYTLLIGGNGKRRTYTSLKLRFSHNRFPSKHE